MSDIRDALREARRRLLAMLPPPTDPEHVSYVTRMGLGIDASAAILLDVSDAAAKLERALRKEGRHAR
jgi:hypothetical protein